MLPERAKVSSEFLFDNNKNAHATEMAWRKNSLSTVSALIRGNCETAQFIEVNEAVNTARREVRRAQRQG